MILFLIFDKVRFKLNKRSKKSILKGLLYTFIGLTLFLVGVNAGFMEVGMVMGEGIARNYTWLLPIIGFLLGLVVVLAEPAVHVLTEQVEDVTAGHIKRAFILTALSIGIAFAVCSSMLRIMIPGLKLWHFLLPGFALGIILSYKVPPIFVGIAFDSGGRCFRTDDSNFYSGFCTRGCQSHTDGKRFSRWVWCNRYGGYDPFGGYPNSRPYI